jgi:hypothetical protein
LFAIGSGAGNCVADFAGGAVDVENIGVFYVAATDFVIGVPNVGG